MVAIPEVCQRLQRAQGHRTLVMGILNCTPDSFYDGGRYATLQKALARAEQMIAEGADILDIGGESTRPGATPVPLEEELRRTIPIVEALAARYDIALSIDTTKSEVARRALQAGAHIVNDISGMTFDPRMPEVVAEAGAMVILMHIQGTPQTMQQNPTYGDVVREVRVTLAQHAERALRAGIARERIWIDPGIGFGKRLEHNLRYCATCLNSNRWAIPCWWAPRASPSSGRYWVGCPRGASGRHLSDPRTCRCMGRGCGACA
jgi:dihydropteroate synthase